MKSIKRFDLQAKAGFYVDFTQVLAGMAYNLPRVSTQTQILYYELLTLAPNLSSLVKGFDKTELAIEEGEILNVGPIKVSTLKSISTENFNIEFWADSNLTAEKLFYCWSSFMMDMQTGLKHVRSVYEFDIDLYTFDRNAIDWVGQGDTVGSAIDQSIQQSLTGTPINPTSQGQALNSVGKILTSFKSRRSYLGCYPANFEKTQLSTIESGFVEGYNANFICNRGMRIQYNPITIKY